MATNLLQSVRLIRPSTIPTIAKSAVFRRATRPRNFWLRLKQSRASFRDGPMDQTSDVQLHIGESRDSGFALRAPGMTTNEKFSFGFNLFLPVQPHFQKYSRSRLPQIKSISPAVPPHRGAYRDRHGRGAGCGGRGSVRRCQGTAGRVDTAHELTNGTQTNDANADGKAVWS